MFREFSSIFAIFRDLLREKNAIVFGFTAKVYDISFEFSINNLCMYQLALFFSSLKSIKQFNKKIEFYLLTKLFRSDMNNIEAVA